jgi:hypothetical protein
MQQKIYKNAHLKKCDAFKLNVFMQSGTLKTTPSKPSLLIHYVVFCAQERSFINSIFIHSPTFSILYDGRMGGLL